MCQPLFHPEATVPHVKAVCILPQVAAQGSHLLDNCFVVFQFMSLDRQKQAFWLAVVSPYACESSYTGSWSLYLHDDATWLVETGMNLLIPAIEFDVTEVKPSDLLVVTVFAKVKVLSYLLIHWSHRVAWRVVGNTNFRPRHVLNDEFKLNYTIDPPG